MGFSYYSDSKQETLEITFVCDACGQPIEDYSLARVIMEETPEEVSEKPHCEICGIYHGITCCPSQDAVMSHPRMLMSMPLDKVLGRAVANTLSSLEVPISSKTHGEALVVAIVRISDEDWYMSCCY